MNDITSTNDSNQPPARGTARQVTLPFAVRGTVTEPGGRRARGLIVMAFDQDLRRREELGRAQTDGHGEYVIEYSAEHFTRAEKGSADLVVEVIDPAGQVLHTTGVLFHAPRQATIDVALPGRGAEAEFDRIARELAPLLEAQEVGFDAIEEDEKHRDV
ncbi:MAG TPA: hypothetical protein VJ885_01640, partial [Thermoanaerobaculia bacterium]|nr:hypothetical protein [Thermoanaerobaculia bacterium]